jgi:hypothetical protein
MYRAAIMRCRSMSPTRSHDEVSENARPYPRNDGEPRGPTSPRNRGSRLRDSIIRRFGHALGFQLQHVDHSRFRWPMRLSLGQHHDKPP